MQSEWGVNSARARSVWEQIDVEALRLPIEHVELRLLSVELMGLVERFAALVKRDLTLPCPSCREDSVRIAFPPLKHGAPLGPCQPAQCTRCSAKNWLWCGDCKRFGKSGHFARDHWICDYVVKVNDWMQKPVGNKGEAVLRAELAGFYPTKQYEKSQTVKRRKIDETKETAERFIEAACAGSLDLTDLERALPGLRRVKHVMIASVAVLRDTTRAELLAWAHAKIDGLELMDAANRPRDYEVPSFDEAFHGSSRNIDAVYVRSAEKCRPVKIMEWDRHRCPVGETTPMGVLRFWGVFIELPTYIYEHKVNDWVLGKRSWLFDDAKNGAPSITFPAPRNSKAYGNPYPRYLVTHFQQIDILPASHDTASSPLNHQANDDAESSDDDKSLRVPESVTDLDMEFINWVQDALTDPDASHHQSNETIE